MALKFWVRDASDWRQALKKVWGYDGTAWRRVRKAWSFDGSTWRAHFTAATLANVAVGRLPCTSSGDFLVSWTASGELTGWTITITNTQGANDTGINPADGAAVVTYIAGDSELTSVTVALVNGSLHAVGSPITIDPPIPCA